MDILYTLAKKGTREYIIPFKPSGISHSYELGQSISVLRVVGWYFTFLFEL